MSCFGYLVMSLLQWQLPGKPLRKSVVYNQWTTSMEWWVQPFPWDVPPPSPTYLTLMSFHPPRVCPALKQNSITHLTLAGEQSLSARTHALEGFQTNPTIEVFVVSIGVGGSASTLHVQTECTSWWSTHDKVLHSSLNWQLSLQDTLGILRWFNKQWTVFIGSVKHKKLRHSTLWPEAPLRPTYSM